MSTDVESRVVVVQQSVRRYREPFFERLRRLLAEHGVALGLIQSDDPAYLVPEPHRAALSWIEARPGRRWSAGGRTVLWQSVLRATRDADLVIVEQAANLLTNYALLARQWIGGPRVALWGHGRNYLMPEGSRSASEWAKRVTSRRPHWWFAYNERAADVVAALGYPRERITVVNNATDTRWLAKQVAATPPETLAAARLELGLSGDNVCLFVGTLGAVKRFDHLFAAADLIRDAVPDFELVLVGSGMEEPVVAAFTAQRSWAHHAGPRFGDELVPLLATAKLLLVPGWAGLVVVDSFGAGVPLVASASLPHPPEIAYLHDGVNGRLVDDGGDPARYARAVVELLRNSSKRQDLVKGCAKARGRYSAEAMASRFAAGIQAALQ